MVGVQWPGYMALVVLLSSSLQLVASILIAHNSSIKFGTTYAIRCCCGFQDLHTTTRQPQSSILSEAAMQGAAKSSRKGLSGPVNPGFEPAFVYVSCDLVRGGV